MAPTASSAPPPAPPDDPQSCLAARFEPPDATHQPLGRWLATQLAELQSCYDGRAAANGSRISLELRQFPDAPVGVRVAESDEVTCPVAPCLKERLTRLLASAPSDVFGRCPTGCITRITLGSSPLPVSRLALVDGSTRSFDTSASCVEPREAISTPDGLEREAAKNVFASQRGRLRHCYEQALLRNPKASGQVRMRLVIDSNGYVAEVRTVHNELPDCAAVACAREVLSGLVFPKPGGKETVIVVPFVFVPDDQ